MRWPWLVVFLFAAAAACSKAPTCATCAGCCDANGQCLAGTSSAACGQGGEACRDCFQQHSACVAQTCVLAPDGGGPGGGGGTGGGAGGGGGAPTDAGPDDAGASWPDGGPLYRYWDGGACAVKTDCPCFSSDDCGPGFTCHSEDNTGTQVWCVPGARGAGLAGDACTGEADCLSSLCTDSASAGMRCSALCDTPADCPASLPKCQYIGFGIDRSICAP